MPLREVCVYDYPRSLGRLMGFHSIHSSVLIEPSHLSERRVTKDDPVAVVRPGKRSIGAKGHGSTAEAGATGHKRQTLITTSISSQWFRLHWLLPRTTLSPGLYVYGYELNQVKSIEYLVKKDSDRAKTYNLFINHDEAMDAIAKELFQKCELPLHAVLLRVGSQHTNYGLVFFDDSMVPWKRTPEDTRRLNKLEELLESMGISKAKKAKLGVLCSAACLAYPVELPEMMRRPHRRIGTRAGDTSSCALWIS